MLTESLRNGIYSTTLEDNIMGKATEAIHMIVCNVITIGYRLETTDMPSLHVNTSRWLVSTMHLHDPEKTSHLVFFLTRV